MGITRRDMLRTAASSVVFWAAPRRALAATGSLLPPLPNPGLFSYLTQGEVAFLDAAVERLIPTDELGPGAKDAGVTFFIDQQLAGPFGSAASWYMQGPWDKGTEQQGYQLKLTPAQLYRAGIKAADDYCQQTFKKTFADLSSDDQDKVLKGLEKGDIKLDAVPSKDFFTMLLQNTGEGYFADPIYGGNRNFAGWTLVGFPGPRYNYVNEIEQYGKPYPLPPVGLAGRNANPRKG